MQSQDTTSPQSATTPVKPTCKWDDPEYRRAYFAAYHAAHQEQRAAYHKAYREAHLEEKHAKDREYGAAHREEIRQRAAQWYKDHPKQGRASRKTYYETHREEVSESSHARRLEHLEEYRAYDRQRAPLRRDYARERLRANPEANRARVRAWVKANPEKAKAARQEGFARRKARLLNCHVEPVDRQAIITRDKGICGICGKKVPPKQIVLDHILPLSKGGAHAPYNLQVAHSRCNSIKADGRLPSQLRLNV